MKQRKSLSTPILPGKMTYADTAKWLTVSERTIRRWVRKDNIPYYKVGRRVYFQETDLLRWIESCRVEVIE